MSNLKYVLIAILPIVFLAGCTSGNMANSITAKVGDTVTVNYIGTLNNGTVFDTSMQPVAKANNIYNPQRDYQPLQFRIGAGQMIRGFDQGVIGMKVGETKKIHLQPADAYGDVRSDLIFTVNTSKITNDSSTLKLGGSIYTSSGDSGVITKIVGDNVTIDFNAPFAGKELNFELTLVSINGVS